MAQNYRVSGRATAVFQDGPEIIVTYHNTAVVRADAATIRLQTGGWDTATTRLRMNQASNQFGLGFRVYRKKGVTYVGGPTCGEIPLGREVTIPRR